MAPLKYSPFPSSDVSTAFSTKEYGCCALFTLHDFLHLRRCYLHQLHCLFQFNTCLQLQHAGCEQLVDSFYVFVLMQDKNQMSCRGTKNILTHTLLKLTLINICSLLTPLLNYTIVCRVGYLASYLLHIHHLTLDLYNVQCL